MEGMVSYEDTLPAICEDEWLIYQEPNAPGYKMRGEYVIKHGDDEIRCNRASLEELQRSVASALFAGTR